MDAQDVRDLKAIQRPGLSPERPRPTVTGGDTLEMSGTEIGRGGDLGVRLTVCKTIKRGDVDRLTARGGFHAASSNCASICTPFVRRSIID
jgi:hypothetical protein